MRSLNAVAGTDTAGGAVSASDFLKQWIAGGLIALAVAFTNAGAAIITNRIIQAGTAAKNIGWGTGSTAPSTSDTALVTEAAPTTSGGRVAGTESRVTTSVTNDTYQVAGTVTATGGATIAEGGLFDAATAGNLLMRGTFTGVVVVTSDAIAFTFGLKLIPN